MVEGWGTVRTTEGAVTVTDESLRIRRAPRMFLRGQLARARTGDARQRLAAAASVAGLVLVPVLLANSLTPLWGTTDPFGVVLAVVFVAASLGQFWANYLRRTEIPLSAVRDVSLSPDDRTLTLSHNRERRFGRLDGVARRWFDAVDFRSSSASGRTETTVTLRSEDDVRKIRSVIRSRGIAEDIDAADAPTRTTYPVDTRDGVVFCRACGAQVSPSDRACPACDSPLRVERPVDAESTDPVFET